MAVGKVIMRFSGVSFAYSQEKPILDSVDFSIREGMKVTLMGQNGAGKSTIFNLIMNGLEPDSGSISHEKKLSIAASKQVIPREQLELTVSEFFEKCFDKKVYDIDVKIEKILEVVNLVAPSDRLIKSFSGGQQARLLLASALIQNPDILLLDEPTNNLDKDGITHLTKFLIDYKKTCIVISHDADFLNTFTHGVLYLDNFTRKVEQYSGNYFDLVEEISARIEKENRKNARLGKEIIAKKESANYFAKKGGNLRFVAKKMREAAASMEEEKVDVRREDKTIKPFVIPYQKDVWGELLNITSFTIMKNRKIFKKEVDVALRKNDHLLLTGPNGIGKSTLLEVLASGKSEGAKIAPDVEVGYYRQDFSGLNFNDTVFASLSAVNGKNTEQRLRSVAAGFLITGDLMSSKIGSLSEGQKGLLSFARLVLQEPSLLILDEPTNHINFRHLPVIASALSKYEGAMILVSHVPEFIEQIRIDQILKLDKE